MNIAYLSTFYPYRGGIAQFNASLYRALEKEHRVNAYTFSRQYPDFLFPGKTQLVTAEDKADEIPAIRTLDTINPITWHKTAKLIAAQQPDLLIMKYWMSYMAPCLGYTAGAVRRKGTKVLTVIDNAIPHEKKFFDKSFARYFMNRNDLFVAMSESVKNDILSIKLDARVLLKEHPLYDHFGAIVPKAEARQKLGIHPTKKTILFFGFIRDYKGLDLLIESFGQLSEDYQLIIAGEVYGSFEPYQKQIDALPNKQDVFAHARYISDHEVPLFFGASDAVVLPYKSATQSGISAIAFHFGVPIIATDVGGLKEIIGHEKTGLIVPTPDPSAIAQSINQFYTFDEAHWAENMRVLKDELSWDNFAKALIKFAQS
jgi:glycosyltransferase involved in cell wall biosynthesis